MDLYDELGSSGSDQDSLLLSKVVQFQGDSEWKGHRERIFPAIHRQFLVFAEKQLE